MSVWRERLAARRRWRAERHLERTLRLLTPTGDGYLALPDGRRLLDLCSNDYLGLARQDKMLDAARAAIARHGTGARGSRLITGNHPFVEQVEAELADFKGTESALIFPSGYQANLGLISTVVEPGDAVFVDRLSHACLVDGVRLAGARIRVFPHNDLERLGNLLAEAADAPARWILADAVYSMDGDIAPLPGLLELAAAHDAAIILDDAHGTGVAGATGRGTAEHFGIDPRQHADRLILVATLSKALASQGGVVLGPADLREAMINSCRPFVYSTGISAGPLGAASAALALIRREPGRVAALQARAARTLAFFRSKGLETMASATPIIPLILGEPALALEASATLREEGVLVLPIRPPTVPRGTSRLRLTVSLGAPEDRLVEACERIAALCRSLLSRQTDRETLRTSEMSDE